VNRRGLSIVIASVAAVLVSAMATWPRFHPGNKLQAASTEAASSMTPNPVSASGNDASSLIGGLTSLLHDDALPPWARLTDAERTALAPFATQWNTFSAARKRKWLHIAARYPKMSPQAQQKLHDQMTAWINMTPEQRRIARENYQISKRLPPQTRQNAWVTYQQLPAELKAKLAASIHKHRHTVISAPPTSGVHDINRLVGHSNHGPMPLPSPSASGIANPASQPSPAIDKGS